ncbi:MAG: hypothetical protein R3213_01180 [Flavobacteriaceae bacterium]|nr:hypothetical protein [Flavobacteriaceae bacterium]
MRCLFPLIFAFIFSPILLAQNLVDPLLAPDKEKQEKWVDSVYNSLSLREKIGQLFMVQAFSDKGTDHTNEIARHVTYNKVGGIIYSNGGPIRQAKLNNQLQALSKVPLLIGMDA